MERPGLLIRARSLSWASKAACEAHDAQHQHHLDHSGASLLQDELRRTPTLTKVTGCVQSMAWHLRSALVSGWCQTILLLYIGDTKYL
jgi:hypothetical protein